jgi:hypothetical protein
MKLLLKRYIPGGLNERTGVSKICPFEAKLGRRVKNGASARAGELLRFNFWDRPRDLPSEEEVDLWVDTEDFPDNIEALDDLANLGVDTYDIDFKGETFLIRKIELILELEAMVVALNKIYYRELGK